MANETDSGTGPALFQAPGWIQEDGHDLPIAPDRPAIHDKLRVVLDAAPLGRDHALVRERGQDWDAHLPIYPGPTSTGTPRSITNRSYFGATLMALFNLSPFINFLEEAVNKEAFNDPIFIGLYKLAQCFRLWDGEDLQREEQQQKLQSHLEKLWQCIKTEGPNQVQPFQERFSHVTEFLHYLLDRLERAQLRPGQVGDGDDVDLSLRFKQLFRYFPVHLTPMRCGCAQPVLRRQATEDSHPTGFVLVVPVPEGMNLEQSISRAMWKGGSLWEDDNDPSTRTCPDCSNEVKAHDFDTFAYLPEVFFILPEFKTKRDSMLCCKYTHDEEFIYPRWLDMSAFRDDPERPGDRTDRIYKLQSIIESSDQKLEYKTLYKPTLRISENDWVQYGYYPVPGQYPDYGTFEAINDKSQWDGSEALHLLMYVRDRQVEKSLNLPDEIKPQSNPPQGGTKNFDAYDPDGSDLQRFVDAQDQPGATADSTALTNAMSELGKGRKTSHWMWYMFPQIAKLSRTRLGHLFAIKSLGEAIAYWNHPVLKSRYLSLLQIVEQGPETNLEELFGGKVDAEKFHASLSLFALTCNDQERGLFQLVFDKFHKSIQGLHADTLWKIIPWLSDANEYEAMAWVAWYARINDEEEEYIVPAQAGLSTLVTSIKAVDDNKTGGEPGDRGCHCNNSGTTAESEAAQNIYSELLRLAEQDVDDENVDNLSARNQRSILLGKLILGFATRKDATAPIDTAESVERARRLGRHLIFLSDPLRTSAADNSVASGTDSDPAPENDVAYDDNDEPNYDYPPDSGYATGGFHRSAGDFGLDGSSDEPSEGASLDEEDPHEAVAIPTHPNDPRIEACQTWTLEDLKSEFQKEQLDWRGLRNDTKKHRMKFLKHFELERDYSIYHEGRLRQAIKDRGIVMSNGASRADKAALVDALTEYDTQRLGEMEFVEEDESEETELVEYESEPSQSSEAAVTDTSSANGSKESTPRPRKRSREDDDDDYGEQEEDDDDDYDYEETERRARPKGPVRMRTRY